MNYNQVLDIKNIGKAYKRYSCKWGRMAEWLNLGKHHELHWVLQNINFNLNCGEAVGIIGMNGAGKSTLLKIITGTSTHYRYSGNERACSRPIRIRYGFSPGIHWTGKRQYGRTTARYRS